MSGIELTPWRIFRWGLHLVLLGALLGGAAFADGPTITRGSYLKKRAYQTYAAMTLYVDPTGSDSNACTASGTSACLTLGGALNKVPIHIRHLVTINVATGTYSEVFRVQGFFIEGANGAASTAALTIAGTQAAYTVATGSNSGTVSSYTAPSAGTHALLNDATQTWTVNDLRGRYVFITSGAGSGEYHLITSNTATQLSLAFQFTSAPNASSTYEIRTPGPVFTGLQGSVRGNFGTGAITVSDISLQPASGTAFIATNVLTHFNTTRVRFVGVTSGVGNPSNPTVGPASWSINQTYVAAGTGSGFALNAQTRITATELYVQCTGACSGTGFFGAPSNSYATFLTGTIAGNFATAMISLTSPYQGQSTGLWIDCGAGTNIGILFPTATDSSARSVGSGWAQNTGPYINGCLTGYSLNNPSLSYVDNGTVFTNTTNAITLTAGARAVIEAGTTFTGGTNFLTVDGEVFTDANLTTFTRITGPQGSYATRP